VFSHLSVTDFWLLKCCHTTTIMKAVENLATEPPVVVQQD
jgi:hypothetical protein